MTVVSLGDQTVLEQIKNQLDKLEDVRDIKELKPDRSVYRELMMVKVRASAQDRQAISAISRYFPCNHRKYVGLSPDGHADRRPVKAGCPYQSVRGLRDSGAGPYRTDRTGAGKRRYPIPAIKYNVSRRIFICQRSIIRKIVIYPCWMDRPLPSSVVVRVMPMR